MEDAGLTILDGAQLRDADVSLPSLQPGNVITGGEVMELAETIVLRSLNGYILPETLRTSALRRIGLCDATGFRSKKVDYSDGSSTLRNYVSAIADELKDDPVAVVILDGKTLHMYLEDEDDFAMVAENLFTDLDIEDRGKISKDEIQNALVHMGIESGIPPLLDFPQLSDILKKHGAAGKEELGQAQFAQLLQPILQEVADTLAKKPVVVVLPLIKIANGSKLRKLLVNESLLHEFVEKIMQEEHESSSGESSIARIRYYLKKNGDYLGLPPTELDEMAILYDEIFAEVDSPKNGDGSRKDGLMKPFKEILEKLAERLEANPIIYDLQPSHSKED